MTRGLKAYRIFRRSLAVILLVAGLSYQVGSGAIRTIAEDLPNTAERPLAQEQVNDDSILVRLPSKVKDPHHMMRSWLIKQMEERLSAREQRLKFLNNDEARHLYQAEMRDFLSESLGQFPERTPLRPKVLGRINRPTYSVEKIVFESRPGFFVPACLFLPKSEPPYPAVLVSCGHAVQAKAYPAYQHGCIALAENGIAAMIFDPIGIGERYSLLNDDGTRWRDEAWDHIFGGIQSILLGENIAQYMVWDAIRAIDYLQSRDDILKDKIGAAGNSGGGTITTYLMALDDRVAAAAPSCYVTHMRHLMMTVGPGDCEQNIFGQLDRGISHAEFFMIRAPRPTLLCAAEKDYFPIDGARLTFAEAKNFYAGFGAANRIEMAEAPEAHGWSEPLQKATVDWMRRWLLDDAKAGKQRQGDALPEETLRCSPQGQALLLPGARSLYDLLSDKEKILAKKRQKYWRSVVKREAIDEVRRIAGIRPIEDLPRANPDSLGKIECDGYVVERLVFKPELGIYLPCLLARPSKSSGKAWLILHEKKEDMLSDVFVLERLREGDVVMLPDLRGVNETKRLDSAPEVKFLHEYIDSDWQDVTMAYMLGKSFVGMRTEDTLVLARYLTQFDGIKEFKVNLAAYGILAPPALHAAALEPQLFESVRIERGLDSWANTLQVPVSRGQLANAVHGALKKYDLPDLVSMIGPQKITIIDPRNAVEAGQ